MKAFGSIVLIAGGQNKGLDLDVLARDPSHVHAVVAIGDAAGEVEAAFAGVDARPRWTANRINNTSPIITAAYVMKNQSIGRSWNISEMLSKTLYHGLTLKGAQVV